MMTTQIRSQSLWSLAIALPLLASWGATAQQTGTAPRFRDTASYWAAGCIEGMAAQGIMQGYPDGGFRPGGSLTRAEFAALMVKAYPNAPSVRPALTFTDVPSSHWANSAIQTAAQRGFLVGYPNRQFKPNQVLNKAQAIAILANAQQLNPAIYIDDTLTRYFDDQAAIPDYARGAIANATEANLIVNYPNPRQLKAEQAIARGEVAALLCQARSNSLEARYKVPPQFIVPFKPESFDVWQQAVLLKEFLVPTSVMLNVAPGFAPSRIVEKLPNQLLFFAQDEASARSSQPALWATDGTMAGTGLVEKITLPSNPNGISQDSFPSFIGASAQHVWFMMPPSGANDLSDTLWSSDGTTAGTGLIAETNDAFSQAFRQSQPYCIQPNVLLNGNLVFPIVAPTQTETQLWQNDGANPSSSKLLGQFPHQRSQVCLIPQLLSSTGKQLFFALPDAQGVTQLWRSDETGAIALKPLNPAGEPFTPWQNRVYLEAETPRAGWEWWTSDGTSEGTLLLKDIHPGSESSAPRMLTGLGSSFFALANSPQGFELWATEGSPASTRLIKRLSNAQSGRAERNTFMFKDRIFFSFPTPLDGAISGESGYEFWVTDGTPAGTQKLAQFPTGTVEGFTVFRDRLFFSGGGADGQELWSSDGTPQGTRQVVDLVPGSQLIVAPCLPPSPLNPRPSCPPPFEQKNSSSPKQLTVQGDWLYFLSWASTGGRSLYRTDGTARGTERVKRFAPTNSPSSQRLFKLNQKLIVLTEILPKQLDEQAGVSHFQIWSLP